jgi:hypothetical protein
LLVALESVSSALAAAPEEILGVPEVAGEA